MKSQFFFWFIQYYFENLHIKYFLKHIFQVANLACSMSNNEEGVKLVRMAAAEIDNLKSQVNESQYFLGLST